eukprot:CAMPEP_0197419074 /NCGR_PEP_ID=MMETSP1170-20131217/4577_1 /TAXON_ID=54406 /ORGANISM="Sarcinochrysis sp, Strain CCMP770" /LENGTH=364 /DNA_ID=CAMNT_0042946155 /DNA_START=85 /DNA_END=1179 /DNA_ORIENTATION=+
MRKVLLVVQVAAAAFCQRESRETCEYTWCGAAIGCCVGRCLTPVERWGQLVVNGTRLQSSRTGETVQLVGMSFFWTNPHWHGGEFFNDGVVAELASWPGLSLIRAPVGVERPYGYLYDPDENLGRLRALMDACIARGLYCVIDWHSYEADLYVAESVNFFDIVAREYGSYPNVIFEIFNEPDPMVGERERTWSDDVKPYAEAALAAVRRHSSNVAIVGTPWWCQKLDPVLEDPLDDAVNILYSVHFYAAWQGHDKIKDDIAAVAPVLPLFVSEFGHGCPHIACDVVPSRSASWIDLLDKYAISWANWAVFDKANNSNALLLPGGGYRTRAGDWDGAGADFTQGGLLTRSLIARNYGNDVDLVPR